MAVQVRPSRLSRSSGALRRELDRDPAGLQRQGVSLDRGVGAGAEELGEPAVLLEEVGIAHHHRGGRIGRPRDGRAVDRERPEHCVAPGVDRHGPALEPDLDGRPLHKLGTEVEAYDLPSSAAASTVAADGVSAVDGDGEEDEPESSAYAAVSVTTSSAGRNPTSAHSSSPFPARRHQSGEVAAAAPPPFRVSLQWRPANTMAPCVWTRGWCGSRRSPTPWSRSPPRHAHRRRARAVRARRARRAGAGRARPVLRRRRADRPEERLPLGDVQLPGQTALSSLTSAIFILLAVGALIGTWNLSGTIPTLVYYGIQILAPGWYYLATALICGTIALSIGSSWTTAGTIGVGLVGIATMIGVSPSITAGAVISGAYLGDKTSPLSETTILTAQMVKADVYEHIRARSGRRCPRSPSPASCSPSSAWPGPRSRNEIRPRSS